MNLFFLYVTEGGFRTSFVDDKYNIENDIGNVLSNANS